MNDRNKKLVAVIVVVALLLVGGWMMMRGEGGESSGGVEQAGMPSSGAPASSDETPAMYQVESGIIESRMEGMADVTAVEYFEDFGRRRAQYTTTVVNLMRVSDTSHSVQIWVDGYEIKYDPDKKEGMRMRPIGGAASASSMIPNLTGMSAEKMAEMEIEPLEPRQIAGRTAEGMAMKVSGMKMRAWTWEGILLRSEVDLGGNSPMVNEVTKLELGVPVPAEKFQVPADVQLTDH